MFSFFDYLRRWTCDSIVAGAYDAMDVLGSKPTEEAGDNSDGKALGPVGTEKPVENAEPPKKIASPVPPTPNSAPDLFSQIPKNETDAPLPSRKRGRPPKNPPKPPGLQ